MAEVVPDDASDIGAEGPNAHSTWWEITHDPDAANDGEGLAAVPL